MQTEGWKDADPFYEQKMKTFKHSSKSVIRKLRWSAKIFIVTAFSELATMIQVLESEKETIRSNPETLKVLFNEMIQMCLWYDKSSRRRNFIYRSTIVQGKRDGSVPSILEYQSTKCALRTFLS